MLRVRTPMRFTTSLGAGCLGLALLLATALPPRTAGATREYAKEQDKDCSFCHINSEGGGPRAEQGRLFEANGHKFGVASWSSAENTATYLRARAALLATWYRECDRLLDEVADKEELAGGKTLIDSTRKRYRMFPRTWLRNAKKLLQKGSRGRPNALKFLTKIESQFPESDEGKEAVKLLDEMTADEKVKPEVDTARAVERARLAYLMARTEYQMGDFERARELFQSVLADEYGSSLRKDAEEQLAELTETEKAAEDESSE